MANGDRYGIDFNPTVDRVRVVNDGDENLRLNPNTGALFDDTNLNPPGEKVTSVAYDRVDSPPIPGNTTLFGISLSSSSLVTIGGVNGAPSANGGALMNPKPLGLTLALNSVPGFDISPSGIAYATLEDAAGGLPVSTRSISTPGRPRWRARCPNRSAVSPSSPRAPCRRSWRPGTPRPRPSFCRG